MNLKVWRLTAFHCLQWLVNFFTLNGASQMTMQYVQHGTYMVSSNNLNNTNGSAIVGADSESSLLGTSSAWQFCKSSVSYGLW
jgi:hypothetical protein